MGREKEDSWNFKKYLKIKSPLLKNCFVFEYWPPHKQPYPRQACRCFILELILHLRKVRRSDWPILQIAHPNTEVYLPCLKNSIKYQANSMCYFKAPLQRAQWVQWLSLFFHVTLKMIKRSFPKERSGIWCTHHLVVKSGDKVSWKNCCI